MNAPVRPLFRQQAITTAAGSQIGEPLRTHWRGVAWFTATAGALLVFVLVTTYAPVHRVPAYTDARSGLVRLRAPSDGWVVQRIATEEGAVVRQGDLLAVLGHPQFGADGTDQQAARQGRLQAERTLLDREIQAAREEAAAQHRLIVQRIAGLQAERHSVLADQMAGEQLLASLQTQSEQISAMAAQPSRGEVLINGRKLSSIASADCARLIGVVMQDDLLFHGTVADNISFFDAPVDMAQVVRAAEKANIADDIQALPMQYYSLLAEAAMDISGGQKQRLFIARALYHEPRVLFLDEATSHLDAASERLVSQAVQAMQMTRVLTAHRKETIATADRVVVLDGVRGVVVEGHS